MDTELKNAVRATDTKAQYDTSAKRLLGQKSILAHILVKTVDEFKGMNPKDVVSYIEGTPYISAVPVEPGLTNIATQKSGQRVVSFNTENAEVNEGLVRFDIIFYVRMKDGLAQIIVNVDYSDFGIIPINSFCKQYLRSFKQVYRNNFLIAS